MLSSDQYRAFGTPTTTATTTASATDCFGFGGQWGDYTDGASHLVLCTHRYYDPNAGRFLTRDPIGYAGGLNLYTYCANNAVNDSDPSGYCPDGSELVPNDNDLLPDDKGLDTLLSVGDWLVNHGYTTDPWHNVENYIDQSNNLVN